MDCGSHPNQNAPPPPRVPGVQIRKSPNPLKTIVKSHFGHHISLYRRYLTIFDQKVQEFALAQRKAHIGKRSKAKVPKNREHQNQGRTRKMHNVHERPTWHNNNKCKDTKPKRATKSPTKKIMHNTSLFLFF